MMVGIAGLCGVQLHTHSLIVPSYVLLDVIVNWSQSQYSTSEGITLMVCVEQAEQADKAFSVDVIAPDSEGMNTIDLGYI